MMQRWPGSDAAAGLNGRDAEGTMARHDRANSRATAAEGRYFAGLWALVAAGCAVAPAPGGVPALLMVPGLGWREEAPVGHPADALRRNLATGDTLRFGQLWLRVLETSVDSSTSPPTRAAHLAFSDGGSREERWVADGAAVRWAEHRVAVLSIRGDGELGAGLVGLEVATLSSLPRHVAASDRSGSAEMRLRVPHRITHVTLHHTGSPQPLRPEDDPVDRLRGLQRWGRTDRNWWDVPYHFLIDLDGRIYEGRDWRFMGETNTTYDPWGHLLISVIGNYGLQEPTGAQVEAITALMAWAVARFDVPLDRVGGHYDHAETACPGAHLRAYLEDGTLRRGIEARLAMPRPTPPTPPTPRRP
jgi:hypothetical protein